MTVIAGLEVIKQLRRQSFSYVEKKYGISYRTAVKLLKSQKVLEKYRWEKVSEGEISIGLDGHSFSGREMVVTISNLTDKEVISITKDARQDTVTEALSEFPEDIKKRIKEVCIDMSQGLKTVAEQSFPNAQLVVDHFHVIQDANRRIDDARRIEQEMCKTRIPKRIWLANEEDLDDSEHLKKLKLKYPIVAEFHWVKEKLREMYAVEKKKEAKQKLTILIKVMEKSDNINIKMWAKMLFRWKDEILAFFNNRTTNAYTEGVHTKMKLIKRISYGFKKVDVYVRKVILAFLPFSILLSYHT